MENNEEIKEEAVETPVEETITPDTTETVESVNTPEITPQEEVVQPTYNEVTPSPAPKKKKGKGLIIGIISLLLIAAIIVGVIFMLNNKDDDKDTSKSKEKQKENKQEVKPDKDDDVLGEYKLLANSIGEYDLFFLKAENKEKNMIYSPLSIKYALLMLNEGTDGDSHKQIEDVVGDYAPKKYANSSNMSFANSLFINNIYKDNIEKNYINTLKDEYNAEVIFDDFNGPDSINKWVKEKTLDLIDNLLSQLDKTEEFVLVNALGIDMEWKNPFHSKSLDGEGWFVNYPHLSFYPQSVSNINFGYPAMNFNDKDTKYYESVSFVALINKYDVVKEVGEDKIRETVGSKYQEWLEKDECGDAESQLSVDKYLDKYIKEIGSSYEQVDFSTDFKYYTSDDVIAISKELKEYEETTLEFVAIMPKKETLKKYIDSVKATDISTIISGLKDISLDNAKDGVITYIHGQLPIFDYEYELDLINDLKKMGITDIFTDKADLSKISTKEKMYIDTAVHKAKIEFSNDGIKAAAATALGGKGAAGCGFNYWYEPPVEEIDLTFDKPYLYLIIDKDTNEVWFTGAVYEPKEK